MLHQIDVYFAALDHLAGAVPQLPWWAICLGNCLSAWYACFG